MDQSITNPLECNIVQQRTSKPEVGELALLLFTAQEGAFQAAKWLLFF